MFNLERFFFILHLFSFLIFIFAKKRIMIHRFLSEEIEGYTRSFIQKLIEETMVKIEGINKVKKTCISRFCHNFATLFFILHSMMKSKDGDRDGKTFLAGAISLRHSHCHSGSRFRFRRALRCRTGSIRTV